MSERKKLNLILHILLDIIAVLAVSVLYLFYRNVMAEDMIQELNRDYAELAEKCREQP